MWQVVEVHLLQELHFLHFLHLAERLPRLRVEVIGVLEGTLVVCGDVGLHLGRVLGLFVVGRGDREVRRVVEHVAFLGVDVHLEVADGEGGGLMDSVGHLFDGVALLLGVVGAERLG